MIADIPLDAGSFAAMSRELFWNFRVWQRELASLAAGTLCFIALAALLSAFNGKSIFRWYGITLNALVSILATAAKVLVLYSIAESTSQWKWLHFSEQKRFLIDFDKIDAASRGPWGSFILLWRKNRELIVRIGAVTTVLALAVDPFTQQLIQYQQRLVPHSDGEASVPRADRYSRGRLFNTQLTMVSNNPPAAQTFADADFAMQSAVLYGLTHSIEMTTQQLPHTCTSGNCTWNAFESLSVCNVCNDLSDRVVEYRDYNVLYSDLQTDNGIGIKEMGTAFRLPNGLFIDGFDGWNYTDKYTSLKLPGGVFMTTYGTGNASETVSLQDIDTLIWAMTFLKVHPPQNASVVWPNLPLEARECGLYYCVNRHESNFVNGTLSEEISEVTSAKRDPDSWQVTSSKWAAILNSSIVSSLEFNDKLSAAPRSDLSLGEQYNISQAAVNSISSYVEDLFSTSINITHNVTATQQARLNGYIMSDGNLQYKPSSMQAFNTSSDLPATFSSLAKSMSNSIRANDDGAKIETGTNHEMVSFYKIEWEWISLHSFFIIAATIFTGLTIYQTRLRGTPAWKSSSLAVLSRGLVVGNTFKGAETMNELTERAKSERACLYGTYSELKERREDVELEEIEVGQSDDPQMFNGVRSVR
ncbi:hypothetical protein SBOR_7271 [Sclerotinia borealis F-4128]|uniref:Uncharacterized protein n=1 Tax=Sclerotinia borealis (strain F-4128) TaxID=1432307 RepID=W9C946_SCLBF|nr:hypothetical protein SBOR_7271 [Sclerotinia borealis F-4128]